MKLLFLSAFFLAMTIALSSCSTTSQLERCAKSEWCWDNLAEEMIAEHGKDLLASGTPQDASDYSKNWSNENKLYFYRDLIKNISFRESGWDASQTYTEKFDVDGNACATSGKPCVISTGLTQVSIASCRSYGASATTTEELKIPAKNLECAVKILNKWIPKDTWIGRSLGEQSSKDSGHRGCARYWSVCRPGESKDYIKAKMKGRT